MPGLQASRSCAPSCVTVRGSTSTATRSSIEGDELLGRLIQHEIDHLDGVLLLDRLEPDARKRGAARAARPRRARAPTATAVRRRRLGRDAARTPVRLVFFGTPADAVPRCARSSTPATRSRSSSPSPTGAAGRGGATEPEPGEGRGARSSGCRCARPSARARSIDEVARERRRARRRRRVRPAPARALLDALPLGFVNVHFSLLPRWRGAAPVERAILAGDAETGVCVMRDREGLDTGAVYARRVDADRRRRDRGGAARAPRRARHRPARRTRCRRSPTIEPEPQTGEPTYADKLTVEEFRLDPRRPPDELARVVRAGNPRPGAWTTVDGAPRSKVWRARVWPTTAAFVLTRCNPRASARMSGDAWLRGLHGALVRFGRVNVCAARCARRARAHRGRRVLEGLSRRCARKRDSRDATARSRPTSCTARCASSGASTISSTRGSKRPAPPARSTGARRAARSARTSCCTTSPRARGGVRRPSTRSRRARRAPWASSTRCSVRVTPARAAVARAADRRASRSRIPTGSSSGSRRPGRRTTRSPRSSPMNEPAAVTLRPNPRTATADAARDRAARRAGVAGRAGRGSCPTRSIVRGIGDPAALPAVPRAGPRRRTRRARRSSTSLDAARGERIVDVAAAPGGKATGIAERVGAGGAVVAARRRRRAACASSSSRRAGSGLDVVLRSWPTAARCPLRPASFDRVLVDAPCSGLGVLRRRPEARWRVTSRAIGELAALQRDLLAAAAAARPPGRRAASTRCAR